MSIAGKRTPAIVRTTGWIAIAALTVCPFLFVATPVRAAAAVLEGGTQTIQPGEQAMFPIRGAASEPTDLTAHCTIRDVTGRAVITFDAEGYVPLSEPAVGDRLTLARGETKVYSLTGAIRPAEKGESYIAFSMIDSPASICFPGMDCGGKDEVASKVTVECRNGSN